MGLNDHIPIRSNRWLCDGLRRVQRWLGMNKTELLEKEDRIG